MSEERRGPGRVRTRLREHWQEWFSDEATRTFLRTGAEGLAHPSRRKALRLLDGMRSVLDVGCATGVMFELIRDHRPDLDYVGVDVTERFIERARALHPADAHRFRLLSLYDLAALGRTFDAVLCRHVLEHLPDYVPAVQRLYERAERKVVITFFLPPRPLGRRRRLDEKFGGPFYNHTYDLGRFVDHLLGGLAPAPAEVRIHPRQGSSDRALPWGDRENMVFEVLRP